MWFEEYWKLNNKELLLFSAHDEMLDPKNIWIDPFLHY